MAPYPWRERCKFKMQGHLILPIISSRYYRPPQSIKHNPDLPSAILLLGKVGAGKKSIANRIIDEPLFEVRHSMASVSRLPVNELVSKPSSGDYLVHLLDTIGQYERRSSLSFNELRSKSSIHLVLFVIQNGPVTKQEKEVFTSILKHGPSTLPDISALVVTYCETLDNWARNELIEQYKTDPSTSDIVSAMGKGIYTVGFPHPDEMNEVVRQIYSQSMASDTRMLQKLLNECDGSQTFTLNQDKSRSNCVLL